MRARLNALYEGTSRAAMRFRYGLLVFDLLTVGFVVATSFVERTPWLEWVDLILGLAIAAELVRGHGGRLELARSDAEGTEFLIRLPKRLAGEEAE
mgnify:CR=1 FL=1